MSHSPKINRHSRVNSRASLASVGQMPIINEDDNTTIPTLPLRIPAKNPRRSLGPPRRTPPPPYPSGFPTPLPDALLEYKYDEEDEKTVVGQMTPPLSLHHGRRHHTAWHPDSRQRRCWFILIIAVILVIVVGLAIGLALGLTHKNNSHSSSGDGSNNTSSSIPIGAFVFDTSLQNSSTACTSNANTWTCYPYKVGSPTKFYWTIDSTDSKYYVSSSDNPFAPSFNNISMSLLDDNQESERLVFSFSMNKTVVPSTPLSTNNRAAKCTYSNVTFQATLWTHPGRSSISRRQSSYSSWPGTVEITQVKNGSLGSPKCEDSQGNQIADVQAGAGTCECLYQTPDSS